MQVDFNNVRKQAIHAYECLVQKLNATIDEDGGISIDASRIQRDMDDLRGYVGLIAMIHEESNPEFKDVFSEVFPEEKYGNGPCMTLFNPEKEEE